MLLLRLAHFEAYIWKCVIWRTQRHELASLFVCGTCFTPFLYLSHVSALNNSWYTRGCVALRCSALQRVASVLQSAAHVSRVCAPKQVTTHSWVRCNELQRVARCIACCLCCIYLARVLHIRISQQVTDVKTCHSHKTSIGCVISHIDIECMTSLIYLKASYAFIETLRVGPHSHCVRECMTWFTDIQCVTSLMHL